MGGPSSILRRATVKSGPSRTPKRMRRILVRFTKLNISSPSNMIWIMLSLNDILHSAATRRRERKFNIMAKRNTIMEWRAQESALIKLTQHVSVSISPD